jgi:hypothetical protein
MDVIAALVATLRKMFAGDAILSLAAVACVAIVGLLRHSGILPATAAPWLLAFGVSCVLVVAVNIALFKELRKSNR